MNGLTTPTKSITQNFPRRKPFYKKTLKKQNICEGLSKLSEMLEESILVRMKFSEVPPTETENYHYLRNAWEKKQGRVSETFCCSTKKSLSRL